MDLGDNKDAREQNTWTTISQQKRDIDTMLIKCWATIYNAGPAINQHWVNFSWLLGCDYVTKSYISYWW